MTVICQACQAHNRDKAMFCRGCAAKLPAFAATGPSALQTLPAALTRSRGPSPYATTPRAHRLLDLPGAWAWFAAVLLLGTALIGLLSWVTLTPMWPGAGTPPKAATTPAALAAAVPAAAPSLATSTPTSGSVPFEAALAPGESPVERTAPAAVPPPAVMSLPAPARVVTPASKPVAAAEAPRQASGRADPRVGCEQLFFAFAARCEANHCAQAAYARHPRCDEVRAQRQRDEARRNLSSGY
jgi:hypothetical protein